MQDAALFFRHRAFAAFRRRRKYPLHSYDWRHEVEQARRFIRACRAELAAYSTDQRRAFGAQLSNSRYGAYALGRQAAPRPPTTANAADP